MTHSFHVVTTGSNRGIGLALAQHYAKSGYTVTGICRTVSSELTQVADRVINNVDLTQASDLTKVVSRLENHPIDLLLNVAGMMHWEHLDELDASVIRQQIDVNAIAPLLLTTALIDHLTPQAKVIFLTSRLGSLNDNTSGNGYGYRMSKAAVNMAAKTLAIDLAPKGIAVGILHPGSVKTSLNQLGGEIKVMEQAFAPGCQIIGKLCGLNGMTGLPAFVSVNLPILKVPPTTMRFSPLKWMAILPRRV